ncbi:Arsenical resistance operon trans-acting repressor ArsD [Thalassobacillus cyri]|uniref:Arsenical resistance operon trans-acting repressor ArsD n=1 Tax=Thalassobacillus cyri TaxID=571932 RepID=A0A1H3XUX1_9BACI|nr:arsenite efflux transporter metallochaperone ArsD [Thalassobacillus cyri]SEA02342.1 Arsenical resistance operon trans-acting repressor ArsD [Thalassobacillus cyri]
MKTKVEIFDPAMCCPTGVCGPSVDPELTRISRTVMKLVNEGYDVTRYNLAQEPEQFTNTEVTKLMEEKGTEALPATVVDGKLVKAGNYPSFGEFAAWFDFNESDLQVTTPKKKIDFTTK